MAKYVYDLQPLEFDLSSPPPETLIVQGRLRKTTPPPPVNLGQGMGLAFAGLTNTDLNVEQALVHYTDWIIAERIKVSLDPDVSARNQRLLILSQAEINVSANFDLYAGASKALRNRQAAGTAISPTDLVQLSARGIKAVTDSGRVVANFPVTTPANPSAADLQVLFERATARDYNAYLMAARNRSDGR